MLPDIFGSIVVWVLEKLALAARGGSCYSLAAFHYSLPGPMRRAAPSLDLQRERS
jgi:hypothetical protein